MIRRLLVATTTGALALGQVACSYPSEPVGQGPSTEIVPVEAVKLTPQSIVLTAIGETRLLTATVTPDSATDKAVTWTSSDTSVVTVDAHGMVTATGIGSGIFVTVVTNDGHREASANVGVDPSATVVPVEATFSAHQRRPWPAARSFEHA